MYYKAKHFFQTWSTRQNRVQHVCVKNYKDLIVDCVLLRPIFLHGLNTLFLSWHHHFLFIKIDIHFNFIILKFAFIVSIGTNRFT